MTDATPAKLKAPFNLAAIMEDKAVEVLARHSSFKDLDVLAEKLAVAQSLNKDCAYVNLGSRDYVGDISNTKTFANFRGKLMEAFPDVTDCSTIAYSGFAYVKLSLKAQPAPKTGPSR